MHSSNVIPFNRPKSAARTPMRPDMEPQALVECSSIAEAAEQVAHQYDFSRHPYFVWMRERCESREDFMRTQVGFRFAVNGFSRALAATVARIDELDRRRAVAENVAEEHGLLTGRDHVTTYREYLASLGASPLDMESPCPIPVQAFVDSIVHRALVRSGEESAAMLGIVERLYVDVTRTLISELTARNFAILENQSHYAVHEQLDVCHARDLFDVAEPSWHCQSTRLMTAQALVLGAHHFWELYNGLIPAE